MPQVGAAVRSPKFRRGGCRAAGMLPSARCSSKASAEANVRLSMPLCANSRATPYRKPALSSTTITIGGCAAICHIRVQPRSSNVPNGGGRPLILIKEFQSAVNSHAASSDVRIEGQSSQVEVGLFVCSCAGTTGLAEIVATPTRISLYGDGERCGYPEVVVYVTVRRCFRGLPQRS
jgi:hypothetical protein